MNANNNAKLFEAQAESYLRQNADRFFPAELKGKRGLLAVIQIADLSQVGARWLSEADLNLLLSRQGDPMQHFLQGFSDAVQKTNFTHEVCIGLLSSDLTLCSIQMLTMPKGRRRRKGQGFGRTPSRFSPDGPSAA